jgi:hypothetical protein
MEANSPTAQSYESRLRRRSTKPFAVGRRAGVLPLAIFRLYFRSYYFSDIVPRCSDSLSENFSLKNVVMGALRDDRGDEAAELICVTIS